jgi:thioesterase domain-containing protein
MSRWYADLVSAAQPDGPLVLCGHSFGGTLALEAARLLQHEGRNVARVVMLDSRLKRPALSPLRRARVRAASTARGLRSELRVRRGTDTLDRASRDLFMATGAAFALYEPSPYEGAVTLLLTTPTGVKADRRIAEEWRPHLARVDVVEVPGLHAGDASMMAEPLVAGTAQLVAAAFAG